MKLVMFRQVQQFFQGHQDPEEIAEEYGSFSAACARRARERAVECRNEILGIRSTSSTSLASSFRSKSRSRYRLRRPHSVRASRRSIRRIHSAEPSSSRRGERSSSRSPSSSEHSRHHSHHSRKEARRSVSLSPEMLSVPEGSSLLSEQ